MKEYVIIWLGFRDPDVEIVQVRNIPEVELLIRKKGWKPPTHILERKKIGTAGLNHRTLSAISFSLKDPDIVELAWRDRALHLNDPRKAE